MFDIKNKSIILKINRLVDNLFVWNYKTTFKWKWIEFSDYKEYDFWDDAKDIDFVASLKEDKLLVKRYEELKELKVYFLLDLSENMVSFSKKKKNIILEVFYTLASIISKSWDSIWWLIVWENVMEFIKAKKWINNVMFLFDKIDKWNILKKDKTNFIDWINFFNNLEIKNNLVIVLTDKIDEISDKTFKILSVKNEVIYINIFDYIENNLIEDDNKNNSYMVNFLFWVKNIFISSKNNKKIKEYRELRKNKIENFKNKLLKFNIRYLNISTKDNIFLVLSKIFKK